MIPMPSFRCSLLAAVCLLVMGLTGCGDSPPAERLVWRFAIEESKGSVQHRYATRFEELV